MFIDIHAHCYYWPTVPFSKGRYFCTPKQLLAIHDKHKIEAAVVLPFGHAEVYETQHSYEPIAMAKEYPGRFIPFCNIDARAITNTPDAPLNEWLEHYRDLGAKGVGEMMPNLEWLDPRTLNLLKHINALGWPLIFDANGAKGWNYGMIDDVGMPQLEHCLRHFPKIKFLGHGPSFWSEMAPLLTPFERCHYPTHPIGSNEGVTVQLFRRYTNLYGDLSAGSGWNALARDPEYAVKFLNEFQDRLLFGTDLCFPEDPIRLIDFLQDMKRNGKISEAVFKKIARENAIRLLGL